MEKISIIVPVYNVEKYLSNCLETIINQTYKNIELIVINDGSPDNSKSIIDEYYKKYPNIIKSIETKNNGVSEARNIGLASSTGKYIMFIDSDDTLMPTMIEEMYNQIIKEDFDIAFCDYYKVTIDSNEEYLELVTTNYSENELDDKKSILMPPAPWNKIYKKEFLDRINYQYPKGIRYEDFALNVTLSIYTNKFTYLKKPLYKYYIRENSFMNQLKFNEKIFDITKAIEFYEDKYKENNKYDSYKEELDFLSFSKYMYDIPMEIMRYEKKYHKYIKDMCKVVKDKYPNWKKNKYYKLLPKKNRRYYNVFYYNIYELFFKIFKIKSSLKRTGKSI